MRKNFRKLFVFLLAGIMFLGFVFMGSIPVQAGGAKAKMAIRAYQNFLGQSWIKWSDSTYKDEKQYNGYYKQKYFNYMLADVNSDGIPEMFLRCTGNASHFEGYEAVYYYYKKKVIRAGVEDRIVEFYPKGGIVIMEHHGMGGSRHYIKIPKNGKDLATRIGDVWNTDSPLSGYKKEKTTYYWGVNKTKVSKSQFNSLLKKTAGKKKVNVKSSQWKKNTAENRKKMSKWKK